MSLTSSSSNVSGCTKASPYCTKVLYPHAGTYVRPLYVYDLFLENRFSGRSTFVLSTIDYIYRVFPKK